MTSKLKKALVATAAMAAIGGGTAAIAMAAGGGGPDAAAPETQIDWSVDPAAAEARAAALKAVGGGTVTEVERADDGQQGYEVEVKRPDGTTLEVNVRPDLSIGSMATDD